MNCMSDPTSPAAVHTFGGRVFPDCDIRMSQQTPPPPPPGGPPPPPPDGHVGVYPGPGGGGGGSSLSNMWNKAAPSLAGGAAAVQAAAKKAAEAATVAGKAVGSAASTQAATATASLDNKVGASATVSRAKAMTPEERAALTEKGIFALTIASQVGSLVGGPKMRAASTVAGAAVTLHGAAAAAPRSLSGVAPPLGVAATAGERVVLEAVATVPAGQVMSVTVEGVGELNVVVPAGVQPGQTFYFEAELPVPMGTPAQPPPPPPPPVAAPGGPAGGLAGLAGGLVAGGLASKLAGGGAPSTSYGQAAPRPWAAVRPVRRRQGEGCPSKGSRRRGEDGQPGHR